jgi:hypothetical protein
LTVRDELTVERASERITRSMAVIGALGTLAAFGARGWTWGAGFLLGALLSGLNFRWLRKMVLTLGGEGSPGSVYVALRYLFLGGAAYVILRYSPISLTAVVIGLFVLIVAVFVEVIFEIVYARK